MSDLDLVVYSKGLDDLLVEDVAAVVTRLSLNPRQEFEPRIPELGDLRRMVQLVGWQRKREQREADERQREREYARKVREEREEDARNGIRATDPLMALDGKGLCAMDAHPVKAMMPQPEPTPPCQHCGFAARTNDAAELRRLAAFYVRRAEAAEDRVAMEAEKLAELAEAANEAQTQHEVTA